MSIFVPENEPQDLQHSPTRPAKLQTVHQPIKDSQKYTKNHKNKHERDENMNHDTHLAAAQRVRSGSSGNLEPRQGQRAEPERHAAHAGPGDGRQQPRTAGGRHPLARRMGHPRREHAANAPTQVDALPEDVDLEVVGNTLRLRCDEKLTVELLRTDSVRLTRKSGTDITITVPYRGVYVLKATGKHHHFARKVAIN